jgi:hypothetical protein
MQAAMPVDSVEIYMHLHMTTMELDARQGGAMALYGPKVSSASGLWAVGGIRT